MVNPSSVLAALWREAGGSAEALRFVELIGGAAPALATSFAVAEIAQASIAAVALAAAELWHVRTGRRQMIEVAMLNAVEEFRSEKRFRLNGERPRGYRDALAGLYSCARGGWVRPHLTFPQHRDGILRLLGCEPACTDKALLQEAFLRHDAIELEEQAAAQGLPLAALRTFAQWDAHPQATAVAELPLVAIERIGDAPPRRLLPTGLRPLDGVRVLELARIIAGPVAGRALAAHGADVMTVSAPHLPSVQQLVMDMGRGKLRTWLDLRVAEQRSRLVELLQSTDVFLQAYRPGALSALGLGAQEVASLCPGIVYGELSAWGWSGPWAGRRGYDSLVQTACGFNHAEADAAGMLIGQELPVQALDHASGYLLALGVMNAMLRQMVQGGSWRVRVCLARTGLWLRSLGQDPSGFFVSDAQETLPEGFLETHMSGFGEIQAIRHAAWMSETPARWVRPSVPLGTHQPCWSEASICTDSL